MHRINLVKVYNGEFSTVQSTEETAICSISGVATFSQRVNDIGVIYVDAHSFLSFF